MDEHASEEEVVLRLFGLLARLFDDDARLLYAPRLQCAHGERKVSPRDSSPVPGRVGERSRALGKPLEGSQVALHLRELG